MNERWQPLAKAGRFLLGSASIGLPSPNCFYLMTAIVGQFVRLNEWQDEGVRVRFHNAIYLLRHTAWHF